MSFHEHQGDLTIDCLTLLPSRLIDHMLWLQHSRRLKNHPQTNFLEVFLIGCQLFQDYLMLQPKETNSAIFSNDSQENRGHGRL